MHDYMLLGSENTDQRRKIMLTYEEYEQELAKNLTWLERLADGASGLDERIDITNRLLIEMLKTLGLGLQIQLPPPAPVHPLVPYNVRMFLLNTARSEPGERIEIPGDSITAYTDGTLVGCYIRLDSPTNDAVPLSEFNPYYYPAKFKEIWLETTVQVGKYLRLHIGREAGAEAAVEITAAAPKMVFYTITTDKDAHFTGSLAQYAKEDENLTGLLGNKIRINKVAIQADQNLDFYLFFWRKNTFDDTNLNKDAFIGMIELDLGTLGLQVGGTGQYYLSAEALEFDYEDEDKANELHVSLYNASAAAKNAGATGEVVCHITYELRS